MTIAGARSISRIYFENLANILKKQLFHNIIELEPRQSGIMNA